MQEIRSIPRLILPEHQEKRIIGISIELARKNPMGELKLRFIYDMRLVILIRLSRIIPVTQSRNLVTRTLAYKLNFPINVKLTEVHK